MKTAILITYDRDDILDEALGLCDAARYDLVDVIKQRYLKHPKYGIGSGTLDNLKCISNETNPDVIIYDEILKPSQNYNLASVLGKEILDRETLILEIFESRASSAESKLQVKLAQLRYEMARAKERVRLSSMGEQPGFMGIGKFGVDVYYNDIKNRMNSTRTKLEKSGRQRELHRRARKRAGFSTLSLAGYTSAGKTTLFNYLTGESNQKSKELFTTLSTTTRRTTIYDMTTKKQKAILISDTVGFISKLPAYMIDAFRSTLEELGYVDVIILVVDFSESTQMIRKKISSCHRVLDEIGIDRGRIIYALNKVDMINAKDVINNKISDILDVENDRWVVISAQTGENIEELKSMASRIIYVTPEYEKKVVNKKWNMSTVMDDGRTSEKTKSISYQSHTDNDNDDNDNDDNDNDNDELCTSGDKR